MKKTFFILSLFFIIHMHAQNNEEYSKSEIGQFLKAYKQSLDSPFDLVSSMKKNALKIKISEERLSEILQSQVNGIELELTNSETFEMNTLKELMELDKKEYDTSFENYLKSINLDSIKFYEMKKLFNNNKDFQKTVINQMSTN
jgi:hypothetical protein